MDDHGLGRGFGKFFEGLGAVIVAADEAGDLDARDIATAGFEPARRRDGGNSEACNRDYGNDDCAGAPERQLASHPATVDDGVGIERHGSLLSHYANPGATIRPRPDAGKPIHPSFRFPRHPAA